MFPKANCREPANYAAIWSIGTRQPLRLEYPGTYAIT